MRLASYCTFTNSIRRRPSNFNSNLLLGVSSTNWRGTRVSLSFGTEAGSEEPKKLLHPLVPLTRIAECARSQREPPRRLLSWPSTPCQDINANGQRFVFPYLQKDVHCGHVTPSAAPCPASGWKTPIRCRTTRRPAASLRQRFSSPGRPSPPTRPAPEGRSRRGGGPSSR